MINKNKTLSVPENRGLQRFLYILSASAKKLQELRQTVGLTGGITQLKKTSQQRGSTDPRLQSLLNASLKTMGGTLKN